MVQSYSHSSPRSKKRVSLYDISPEFLLPNPVSLAPNLDHESGRSRSNSSSSGPTAAHAPAVSATMTTTMPPPIPIPITLNGNRFADITNRNGSRSPSPVRGRRSSFTFPPAPATALSSSPYKALRYSSSRESLEQTAIDENSTRLIPSRGPSPIRHSVRPKDPSHSTHSSASSINPFDSSEPFTSFSVDGVSVGSDTNDNSTKDDNASAGVDIGASSRSVSPVRVTRKPFNFQSTVASRSPVNKASQRRGHKYKHSSVSMNFFLEPPPRPPPVLPAHFPVPTHTDAIQSMSRDQKIQLGWCGLHFLVGLQLWLISYESTTLMALSHIIFYDAFAATLSVLVDVLSNFEVWKTSSIRHPFGLQRAEILAGFASTVGLLFMGIDIGSHLCENFVKRVITESSPHDHETEQFFARGSSVVIVLAMLATVVSSIVFKSHERIGTAVQFSYIRKLPYGLNNPLYLTTISSCLLLLSLPLWTSEPWYGLIDGTAAIGIAFMMCFVGWMTALTLGRMLLMGFNGACAAMILREIQADPDIKRVEESQMWTVHYGLSIVIIRLRLRGPTVDEARVRSNVNRIIGDVLRANMGAVVSTGDSHGFASTGTSNPKYRSKTGTQWESTIDIDWS